MLYFENWKIALISVVCLIGVLLSIPSFVGTQALQGLPGWVPARKVTLGLDLQGGSHLLLEVDVKAVIVERLNNMVDAARTVLRQERIGYTNLGLQGDSVVVTVRDAGDVEVAHRAAQSRAGSRCDLGRR